MASRTEVDPVLSKLNRLADRVADSRAIFLATTGTMAQVAERVWGKGLLTDGSRLSYVENYPVRVYSPPFPRQAKAKLGKPGPDGKRRKTKGGWFPTYLAAKADQGRADLPFELTGRLRKQYFGGGATPKPEEETALRCTITLRGEEAAKFVGLTETKGPFLQLNAKERTAHTERVRRIFANLIKELGQ